VESVTTIAYRGGIIAADSLETHSSEAGGTSTGLCEKLFRKRIGRREIVIGTAGGSFLGMVFVDWFDGTSREPPPILRDAHLDEDFDILVLDRGKVFQANHLCRLVEVIEPFTAIGSGRKVALGALEAGCGARRAGEIAARRCPYTGGPIKTMAMPGYKKQ
jgi:hypothetical protein